MATTTGKATWRERLFSTHRGRPQPWQQGTRWLRVLGPGLITGAADDDPSGIGTYSQAGAAFGTGQLWLALYMLPLMIAVQEMCGRIGLVTGKGIAAITKQHYNRAVVIGAVSLVLVANTINVGADLGAMAASFRLLVPVAPLIPVLVAFAVGMVALEVLAPYRQYAVVLKFLTLSLSKTCEIPLALAMGMQARSPQRPRSPFNPFLLSPCILTALCGIL
jgi:Mn2+/Fe2+ NRAMP family transporter